MNRTVARHSLGCKVKSYEAESMEQLLKQAGYTIVPFDENITADIYIINTCSVTNIADRKSRQMLHKSKKINPDAIVVAAGCYVNADTKKAAEDNAVDIVIGNNCKINIVEALENYYKDKNNSEMVVDFKEKGKDALASAVKGMHLTQGLQILQSSLHSVMLSMDQKIDRLGSMAEELHVAKGHLRNAFLEAGGKEVRKLTERNPEQGIIFQTQKVLFQSMRSIHQLEQKTERLQQQIGKLEAREGKQPSVKDTLQKLRQEQHPLKFGKEEKQKSAVR